MKLTNATGSIAAELLEGVIAACHGRVKQLDVPGPLVKTRLPRDKVGLVIGGVCGHEPLFSMLIGEGLADGAANGGLYNAPAPEVIAAATQAVDQGLGVLLVYGNWRSNVDRFAQAEKMVAAAGIETRTVRVWDDIASAPPDEIEQRGGTAGDMAVIKVAGAATAKFKTLAQAYAVTARARDNTRSISVVLSAGTIPGTGEALYTVPKGRIQVGSTLHGQGAAVTRDSATADPIVEAMMEQLLNEKLFAPRDEIYLLINNLGSATYLEMLIVNRKVRQILRDREIKVHQTLIGSYFTCQETCGLSITMMKLDEELRQCVDAPADSLGLSTPGRPDW